MSNVKGISKGLLPQGTFQHGRNQFLSEKSQTASQPYIGLLEPFTLAGSDIASGQTTTLLLYFLLQDSTESSAEEQENIVAIADIISDQWLEAFQENVGDIEIQSFQKEPAYRILSGTWSGYIVSMDIQAGGCDPNVFPDISKFTNEISRKISPYDWQGVMSR